jgi:hypothetical protein
MRAWVQHIGWVIVCAWALLPAAQLAAEGVSQEIHPITPAMLVSALAKQDASLAGADISVPAGVVARAGAPDFVVLSVEAAPGANSRYWVKIGCRNAGECLPFFASVVSDKPLTCGERQPVAGRVVPAQAPAIHAGDHATLVIRRERSVIELSVVALESGATGQSIRVATPDYKQVFHGHVVSPTQIEGAM